MGRPWDGTALATSPVALGRDQVSWTARVRRPDAGAPVGTTPRPAGRARVFRARGGGHGVLEGG